MTTIAEQYCIPDIPEENKTNIFSGKYIRHLGEICKPVIDASHHINDNETPVFGNTIDGVVMFIDIGSFTERSGQLTPGQTAYWVNRFLKQVWPICEKGCATLDKIIGDCLMLVLSKEFGCTNPVQNAYQIAIDILRNDTFGYYPHIGIADGEFWLGYTGPPQIMSISIFGDAVNFASRLASVAESNSFAVSKRLSDSIIDKSEIINDFEILKGNNPIKDFNNSQYKIVKRKAKWYPQGHLNSFKAIHDSR